MTPLKKHQGSIEWHDGREPAYETYDYYLAADVEALFVDRSEWGQERDRLTARITELERDIERCQRSNAALLVCGAQNCEPYRSLQSQLVTLEQRAQEDRIIMALGGDQTEWYARQLAMAQARIEELVVSREKEVDRMMAQRNLAEAKLLVLEQREVGYLSELDDYARTVLNLRSWVKACENEHGLHRVQP